MQDCITVDKENSYKPEIHNCSTFSLQLRLGTVQLLIIPTIEGDVFPHFSSDDEVEAAVHKWIRNQPETFFMDGMKKRIDRLENCVAGNVDCVEK